MNVSMCERMKNLHSTLLLFFVFLWRTFRFWKIGQNVSLWTFTQRQLKVMTTIRPGDEPVRSCEGLKNMNALFNCLPCFSLHNESTNRKDVIIIQNDTLNFYQEYNHCMSMIIRLLTKLYKTNTMPMHLDCIGTHITRSNSSIQWPNIITWNNRKSQCIQLHKTDS